MRCARHWPAHKPLSWRLSLADEDDGGMPFDDLVAYASGLRDRGVDLIDASSGGGIGGYPAGRGPVHRTLAFRAATAAKLRAAVGLPVLAVGEVIDPHAAEALLRDGCADFVALGREALFNPNWPVHAEMALGANADYATWPRAYRMWLQRRAPLADPVRAAAGMAFRPAHDQPANASAAANAAHAAHAARAAHACPSRPPSRPSRRACPSQNGDRRRGY